MDEDFIFKVPLVLFCLALLLWIIVLLLIFWLGKIHQQVDSISKGWSIYCKLASCEESPVTKDHQPECLSSPLPLVFFNQQAAYSNNANFWRDVNRAFAYASVRSDVVARRSSADDTASALPGEDKISVDGAKTQEQTIPDVPVASYLQIIDHNPTIVAVSSSEHPAKDAKGDKRRIYISVSSVDDDADNNMEHFKDSAQIELKSLRLNDAEGLASDENASISFKSEANTQQSSSKANDISEAEKTPEVDKPECVVLMEGRREPEASVSAVQLNVISSQSDEQKNKQESSEVEKNKAKANSEIVDGEKQPSQYDHVVSSPQKSPALSETTGKAISRHGSESEQFIPIEIQPKGKVRRKKKKRTSGTHSDATNKAEGHKSPLNNVTEEKSGYLFTQDVEQLEKTGSNGVSHFQQTQQTAVEQFKSAGVSKNEYETEETGRNGSSSIVLQLRNLLEQKFNDPARCVVREIKSTDGREKAAQENEAREKYVVKVNDAKTTDLDQGHGTTTEQIYANVDNSNDDLYCEIPAFVQPDVIYANQYNSQNVGNDYSPNCPIYANIDVRHGIVTYNGNATLENDHGFAIYNNDIIDV